MWNISVEGNTEVYVRHNDQFVARFKYASPKASANHFVKFLTTHFTPEQYFAEYKRGMAPTIILQTKGYVSYNVQKAQKQMEKDKQIKRVQWAIA